jgi:hypothetical protein
MRLKRAVLLTMSISMALQGCAAALIPVAAGGMLVKSRIDGANRARQAEASVGNTAPPIVIVGDANDPKMTAEIPAQPAIASAADNVSEERMANNEVATENAPEALPIPELPSPDGPIRGSVASAKLPDHPYADFAKYALEQADKRDAREIGRSAVLVEKVSLAFPKMIECSIKPLAVIIDVDADRNTTWDAKSYAASLAEVAELLRARDIRLIWFTDGTQNELPEILGPLRSGAFPAVKSDDLISFGAKKGKRKQERRWKLADDYCVVAVAGDTKSDFDELYDYLRDQSFAIRLDAFWNRGWFLLPPPSAVIGNSNLALPASGDEPK